MERIPTMLLLCVLACLVAGPGCAGPKAVVHLDYALAPDLPLPRGARHVRISPATVFGTDEGAGAYATKSLARHVRSGGWFRTEQLQASASATTLPALHAAGLEPGGHAATTTAAAMPATLPAPVPANETTIRLSPACRVLVKDTYSIRTVRRPRDGKLADAQLRSLRRQVSVLMEVVVLSAAGGREICAAQARQEYDSLEDSRSRGPQGIGRNDDPATVVAAGVIVEELVDNCARTIADMMTPVRVGQQVTLRPVRGPKAAEILRAVRQKRYREAAAILEAARSTSPEPDRLYNLAVLQEAAGQFKQAAANYRECVRLAGNRDERATQGLLRATRAGNRALPEQPAQIGR